MPAPAAGQQRLARLRWDCRRGMKELDVLLERFLDREAVALGQGGFPELEHLLGSEDDHLWDWLQAPSRAPVEWQALLRALRE